MLCQPSSSHPALGCGGGAALAGLTHPLRSQFGVDAALSGESGTWLSAVSGLCPAPTAKTKATTERHVLKINAALC